MSSTPVLRPQPLSPATCTGSGESGLSVHFRACLCAQRVLLKRFTLMYHRAHGVLVYGAFSNVEAPRINSPAPVCQAASRPVSVWPIACPPVCCETRFCLSGCLAAFRSQAAQPQRRPLALARGRRASQREPSASAHHPSTVPARAPEPRRSP